MFSFRKLFFCDFKLNLNWFLLENKEVHLKNLFLRNIKFPFSLKFAVTLGRSTFFKKAHKFFADQKSNQNQKSFKSPRKLFFLGGGEEKLFNIIF